MINSNARRAMAAGSAWGPGHIEMLGWSNMATSEGTILVQPPNELQQHVVLGNATASELSFSGDLNAIGWYLELAVQKPAGGTTYIVELKDYASSPILVAAGDAIWIYHEYIGVDPLPQSVGITIYNETTGGDMLASYTVTFNPEPV